MSFNFFSGFTGSNSVIGIEENSSDAGFQTNVLSDSAVIIENDQQSFGTGAQVGNYGDLHEDSHENILSEAQNGAGMYPALRPDTYVKAGIEPQRGEDVNNAKIDAGVAGNNSISGSSIVSVLHKGGNLKKRQAEGADRDDAATSNKHRAQIMVRRILNNPSAPGMSPVQEETSVMPWKNYREGDAKEVLSLSQIEQYIAQTRNALVDGERKKFKAWILASLNDYVERERNNLRDISDNRYGQRALLKLMGDLTGNSGPVEEIRKEAFCENAKHVKLEKQNPFDFSVVELSETSGVFHNSVKCLRTIGKVSEKVILAWLETKVKTYFPKWSDNYDLSSYLRELVREVEPLIDDLTDAMVYQLEMIGTKATAKQDQVNARRDNAFQHILSFATTVFCNIYLKDNDVAVRSAFNAVGEIAKAATETAANVKDTSNDAQAQAINLAHECIKLTVTNILNLIDFKVCRLAIRRVEKVLSSLIQDQIANAEYSKKMIERNLLCANFIFRDVAEL